MKNTRGKFFLTSWQYSWRQFFPAIARHTTFRARPHSSVPRAISHHPRVTRSIPIGHISQMTKESLSAEWLVVWGKGRAKALVDLKDSVLVSRLNERSKLLNR
jgi:hypothetical protein